MKTWGCIIGLGILCAQGVAQGVSPDKLLDDAASALMVQSIDVELLPLTSEIVHPQFLPKAPPQKAEAITRQNQAQFDLPFTLQCYRNGKTSVFFGLRVLREEKLASFTYADLYIGKAADDPWEDAREALFIPDPKATMKMRISLDEVLVEGSTNMYFRGSFQLPIDLAEELVLRLHCREKGTYNNSPIGFENSKSYVIDLASFIPEPPQKALCTDCTDSTNEVLNITIGR